MSITFTLIQTPTTKNLYLYPSGAYHSGCSIHGDVSGFLCVDDDYDIPDETTYTWMIGASTVTDMYLIDDTTETGTINYVRIYARAKSYLYTLAGTAYYRILANHSGTTSRESKTLTTGYNTNSYLLTSTPSGGAWNWTAINALRIGWDAYSPAISGQPASITLRPNGIGTYTQLTPYGETNNWGCVNEVIADGYTSYVSMHGTSYLTDSYTMTNHTTEAGVITGITLVGRFNTYMAPVPNAHQFYKFGVKTTGSPIRSGPETGFETLSNWADYSYTWTTNPTTAAAWTWNEMDNIECGFAFKVTNVLVTDLCTQFYMTVNYLAAVYPHIRTTQIYAMVNYTPSSATCYLSKPYEYEYTNNRGISKINTWSGKRKVYDNSRISKTLTMAGMEYRREDSDTITPETRLGCIRAMKDNAMEITITGFNDDRIDEYEWLITDFTWSKNAMNTNIYDWDMTLERYENDE